MSKKLHIKTFGCQMNVYDSDRMADALLPLGFALSDDAASSDMVILNTCHIREKAAEKVYSDLGRLRDLQKARREAGADMTIAVAGCVAQAEGREILRRAPHVDLVVGPQAYHRLPEMVARVARVRGPGLVDTDFPVESKFDRLPQEASPRGLSAFLTVQEGCDKFCTFCVVPYTRGAEFSRPALDVIGEARRLVALGAVEVTLLGQNVNAYHGLGANGREWGLGRLIRALGEIDGLARLRFTTSHPADMDDDLIQAFADEPKLMPYLHLPVQSGSDRILERMNRRHGADDYRRVVERLRGVRSDLALSSDFIVGSPGESDRDFAETIRLVTDIGFAQAYSFKFSPRPGTPAALDADQVEEHVKAERLAALQALLAEQQAAFNQACVGWRMQVLLERPGRRPNQAVGRSPYMHAVHVRSAAGAIGSLCEVQIEAAHPNSLAGVLSRTSDPTAQTVGSGATA